MPLTPEILLQEVVPEKCSFFVSAMLPLKLVFSTAGGGPDCTVIYKSGDDLRQDQLVLQIFSLMDRLLKKENLDLKLTPYRVLATSSVTGLLEFAPGTTIQKIEKV
jgi:phosphatidylinositol 3-kinase